MKSPAAIASLLLLLLLLLVPAGDPARQDRANAPAPPSVTHPLGTDELGHDLWARFVHGGRWSMGIGAAAATVAITLAWLIGTMAGWWGGWLDALLMWTAELFLAIPWLYLLIALRATLPPSVAPREAAAAAILLVALAGWARPARLVRGVVLAERERGWVEAAHGFGVPAWAIYRRHILPATLGLLATQAVILLPRFVLAELTLTFAGAGAADGPSWGALVVPLKQAYLLREQWWLALPLLAMIPVFAGFAVLARTLSRQPPPYR